MGLLNFASLPLRVALRLGSMLYPRTYQKAVGDDLAFPIVGHPNVGVFDGSLVEWNSDRSPSLELSE